MKRPLILLLLESPAVRLWMRGRAQWQLSRHLTTHAQLFLRRLEHPSHLHPEGDLRTLTFHLLASTRTTPLHLNLRLLPHLHSSRSDKPCSPFPPVLERLMQMEPTMNRNQLLLTRMMTSSMVYMHLQSTLHWRRHLWRVGCQTCLLLERVRLNSQYSYHRIQLLRERRSYRVHEHQCQHLPGAVQLAAKLPGGDDGQFSMGFS
jgi:hypothetical protein